MTFEIGVSLRNPVASGIMQKSSTQVKIFKQCQDTAIVVGRHSRRILFHLKLSNVPLFIKGLRRQG